MTLKRTTRFGVDIDLVTMNEAVDFCLTSADRTDGTCRYVVTPNVDHIVQLQKRDDFREAYRDASLAVIDGKPVLWAMKLLGEPAPELVPGSDLLPTIFESVPAGDELRVFLLGAGPGVAERAAEVIETRWPNVRIVGCYSPPFGFEQDEDEKRRIVRTINEADPQLLAVGLGAPKQELWVKENRHLINANVAVCIGATIDFFAGEQKRAPVWMRRLALEWLHRMLSNPKRLFKRYAIDAVVFPSLVAREWLSRRRRPTADV